MDLKEILKEIDSLPWEEKLRVYSYLTEKLRDKKTILDSIYEIKGIGKGVWNEDAQEYVRRQRANDRSE